MGGANLLFGLRAHYGEPDSARAEMQFTRSWLKLPMKASPETRVWHPVGVYHQIAGMFGLSYRRRWFCGVFVFGKSSDHATEPLPTPPDPPPHRELGET